MFSEREKTLTALICCCHVRHSIALIALHDEAVVKARSQKHLKDQIQWSQSPPIIQHGHYCSGHYLCPSLSVFTKNPAESRKTFIYIWKRYSFELLLFILSGDIKVLFCHSCWAVATISGVTGIHEHSWVTKQPSIPVRRFFLIPLSRCTCTTLSYITWI